MAQHEDPTAALTQAKDEIEALRGRVTTLEADLALRSQVDDAVPDLVAAKGPDLRFRYVNKAFCDFHGLLREQLLGATEADIEPEDASQPHTEQDRRVLDAGIIINIPSEVLVRQDGRKAHFHTLRCPLRDADGKVVGVLCCSRPIQADTHVTAAGAGAGAGHDQLLLSIIPDMYFRIARDGTYLDFSAAKGSDTALPPALFLGKKMHDVTPDIAGPVMACVEAALRTGEMQRLEYRLFVHGQYLDYEARIMVSGPDELLAIVRDITAQKDVERRLREAEDAMRMELSTPLIPISDRIVVMPIIGALDEHRAARMIERLLQGIVERRAAIAILDITGMAAVTTTTASTLVRCAQAVRLLGARVILTGTRPEVAQTMVSMDIDLAGILTLSTLQAGIERAMRM